MTSRHNEIDARFLLVGMPSINKPPIGDEFLFLAIGATLYTINEYRRSKNQAVIIIIIIIIIIVIYCLLGAN